MEVQFYVYGVPKGFDLFEGKPDDIAYFQSYYDGSKENSKFTLHRRNNGLVVYSYLRYNLVDCDGRRGAFFGISIEFNGIYCTDVTGLYELFEGVYETILQQGALLKVASNQTIFGVNAFKDAEKEINRITGILRKNLESAFVDDFQKIDTSFKQNVNEDKVCKLNVQKGNKAILQISKEYSMLSISHDYEDRSVEDVFTYERSQKFSKEVQNLQHEINLLQAEQQEIYKLLNNLSLQENQHSKIAIKKKIVEKNSELNNKVKLPIEKFRKELKGVCRFLQIHHENDGLLHFKTSFINGIKTLEKLQESTQEMSKIIKQTSGNIGQSVIEKVGENESKTNGEITIEKDKNTGSNKSANALLFFLKKQKIKFIVAASIAVAIVIVVFLLIIESNNTPTSKVDCTECKEYLDKGSDFLQKGRFDEAIVEYKKAEAKGIDVTDNIDEVNKQAVDFYTQKADKEFNDTSGRKKFESYSTAIAQLKKANKYGFDINELADSYQKSTINYYFDEIKKPKQSQEKKVEYADYILQIDPNNEDAEKIINPPVNKTSSKTIAGKKPTENKCIKNYSVASDKPAKDYSPKELYEELKKYPETSYQVIIDGCKIIERSCALKSMRQEAKKWREKTEKKKGEPQRR